MKLKLKKIFIIAGLMLCMAMIPVFVGNIQASAKMSSEEVDSYLANIESMITSFGELTPEQLETYKTSGDYMVMFNTYQAMIDEVGAFQKVKEGTAEYDTDGNIVITATLLCADGEGKTVFTVDPAGMNFTATFEAVQSKGFLLKELSPKTLTNLVVICVVLSVLSIFLSLKRYVSRQSDRDKRIDNGAVISAPSITSVNEELVDDTELVAVISAAIAASENTSLDTFVVRSIKRVNNSKWRQA